MSFSNLINNIDRRWIYLFVVCSLALPLIYKLKLEPAEMKTAFQFFHEIEDLQIKEGDFVMLSLDWGPNTLAENAPQSKIAIEHLMRKRIPFAVITNYAQAKPFLDSIPKEVAEDLNSEGNGSWSYGSDWINLGFRSGGYTMIESMAKSENLADVWRTDAYGTPVDQLAILKTPKTIRQIPMLIEFTGLRGVFNSWLQFFFVEGHSPRFLHGCTSISIPEAHTYLASKQIVGLHEGIAGAAWHEKLLIDKYPSRKANYSFGINTGLAYAHLVIIGFMILGNLGLAISYFKRR